jgi:hypothetical protein
VGVNPTQVGVNPTQASACAHPRSTCPSASPPPSLRPLPPGREPHPHPRLPPPPPPTSPSTAPARSPPRCKPARYVRSKPPVLSLPQCPPAHLRGAGKEAELRGHQHHDVFMGPFDESRVVSYPSLAHTQHSRSSIGPDGGGGSVGLGNGHRAPPPDHQTTEPRSQTI